jgi:methionyl-tRNA formyltransferase
MTTPLKIIFMGTPEFARAALKKLHESQHEVIALYSQPPRPKGRGHKLTPSPTHKYAQENGIPVYTPKSLKKAEAQAEFAALGADVAVVAAYGLILPKAVLDAPKHGCLNIHASLLPRWRGASPMQRAIWAGDAQTGITIMQMDEGLDTGPMIEKAVLDITPDTTCTTLHDDFCVIGSDLIVNVINDLAKNGQLIAEAQNDEHTTYAPLLSKDDGRVDWTQSALEIDRQIRALNPWPGVWTDDGEMRLKIIAARVHDGDHTDQYGEVLNKKGHIACGNSTILQLIQIQPSGKKAMDFASALNGGFVKIGDILA